MKKTLIIIDGSSLIYRAFHAIPAGMATSGGVPTNAVYGFTQTLRKIVKDCRPDYICVAFDVKGASFRHGIYPEYKATRPPMPDSLVPQIPYIKRMVSAMNIRGLEAQGFEADDVMATLAKRFSGQVKTMLVTGDKDMYQLVDDDTVILDYLSAKETGPKEVEEKFGVSPALIRDMLSLAGDSSDNIPGVPGVGMKTASKLLRQFGSVDAIYSNIEAVPTPKLREALSKNKYLAFISQRLATLNVAVPVECGINELAAMPPDMSVLVPLLKELEFKRLIEEASQSETKAGTIATASYRNYNCKSIDHDELPSFAKRLEDTAGVAITIHSVNEDDEDMFSASSGTWLGVCIDGKEAFHMDAGGSKGGTALLHLKTFLENPVIVKDTDDSKAMYLFFSRLGVEIKGIGIDTSLASYLLNPSRSAHDFKSIALDYLGLRYDDKEAGGDNQHDYVCSKTCNIAELAIIFKQKLEDESLLKLYADMELPLAGVLADMEKTGIKVDVLQLKMLSDELAHAMNVCEGRIYALAGFEFNINSPKQLSQALFERLGLKPVRKTKTGFSTDEEVLKRLASQHDVPGLIITYRQTAKLKSTYVDALINLADPQTSRVHTSFNQTVTLTGRLSSSRPNLQNIPTSGESALALRSAFVPEQGFVFLSADYSQIELRLVAHLSEDPFLIEAFVNGEDVHAQTASGIFSVLPALVTPEMRRKAKAINFGIIYGMGAWGLAGELKIPSSEAQGYIDGFFAHYKRVKTFMDKAVEQARAAGYTTTLFGRKRVIPELNSPIEAARNFGERAAINTPIQGSAADMIKLAMIRIHERIKSKGFSSRMLLQIHDELVFEARKEELDELTSLVREEMEGIIVLRVPLKVNMKQGNNWAEVE
ncbi:MAG: DNA polymerase I [Deltaproteobacteria bacterium]|nr:DNA polymerase I [Deltaproteobacteria bacterium]